jgi:hypothetical protein
MVCEVNLHTLKNKMEVFSCDFTPVERAGTWTGGQLSLTSNLDVAKRGVPLYMN